MTYLCIDIGGTAVKYGCFHQSGELTCDIQTIPTNMKTLIEDILNIVSIYQFDILGVAISSAGVVDSNNGRISYAGYTMPGYTGVDWKKIINDHFNLPCEVENDVNCACLGEYWKGVAKDVLNVVCLTVGTGVGGSIVLNGELYNGSNFSAGEIGYMPMKDSNFQDLASTKSLVEYVNQRRQIGVKLTGKEIFSLAKNGDELCREAIFKQMTYLVDGIAIICYLLNPEMIVLGGGIMSQETYLKPIIHDLFYDKMISDRFTNTKICFAENGNNANLLGALYHFLNKVMRD